MKKLIYIIILGLAVPGFSQIIVVRDISNREPLADVLVSDKNNKVVTTDVNGRADISTLDKSRDIHLFHTSYLPYVLSTEEKNGEVEISLSSKLVILDEVVLSVNRNKEKKIDVPYAINVIKQKEIEFGNQPTSADVLMNTGAVFVQKSQLGGGSPVLRGFEANRVLLVVDGVRMNNAIYRGGHLQDVISLDANMLERAEIIFGPASTIYGSDALGGVIHFYSKNAEFGTQDKMLVKGNAMLRNATVNREYTTHLDFNLGWKNVAYLANVTVSQFSDLMSGTAKLAGSPNLWDRNYYVKRINERDSMIRNPNNNLQVGSAYNQSDILQRLNIKSGRHALHMLNFQLSNSSNVPRYDRLTEFSGKNPRFAEWSYGPQKRMLAAYTFNYDFKTTLWDNFRLILAAQKLDQDRISRRFQNNSRITQMEDVSVASLNLDIFKRVKEEHELRYGAENQYNQVNSSARSQNIVTGNENKAATRYADGGNRMNLAGLYFSHSWEVNKTFVVSDGMRLSATYLESEFKDTAFFKFPFTSARQNHYALTWNVGFTWKEEDNYKLSLMVNTGFRAPNVDDMTKVFESAGNILIIPNEKIKPEYATNFEMGLSKVFDKAYKFDLTVFYTDIQQALVLANTTYNGKDSVLFNGVKSKVQSMQNKNSGHIYGFSAGAQLDFNKHVSFKTVINYTYGRYTEVALDSVLPLDHIPPVFGQSSLVYREKNTEAEFFIRYNGRKNSSDYSASGEDNIQYSADPVKGFTPAWFTINIRAGYNINKQFRINAAFENITDIRYRVFASGINAPGKNFILSARYKF